MSGGDPISLPQAAGQSTMIFHTIEGRVVPAVTTDQMREIDRIAIEETGPNLFQIRPYPTQAEAIRKAGDGFNRTRLTPGRASLLRRYFAWRR